MVSLVIFFVLMLIVVPTPNLLLSYFITMVVTSTYSFSLYVSDVLPYMLFLVYVGGLLVLVVYLVMLSSNYLMSSMKLAYLFMLMIISLALSYNFGPSVVPLSASNHGVSMEFTILVVLGGFLTFLFVYICNIICVGGNSVSVGKMS